MHSLRDIERNRSASYAFAATIVAREVEHFRLAELRGFIQYKALPVDDLVARSMEFLSSGTSQVAWKFYGEMGGLVEVLHWRTQVVNDSRIDVFGKELAEKVFFSVRKLLDAWHPFIARPLIRLCYWDTDASSRKVLVEQITYSTRPLSSGGFDVETREALSSLVHCCIRNGEFSREVGELQKRVVEAAQKFDGPSMGPNNAFVLRSQSHLLRIYIGQEKWVDAEKLATKLATLWKSETWERSECLRLLADAQIVLGRIVAAEKTLMEATKGGINEGDPTSYNIMCWDMLVQFYTVKEDWEKAERCLNQLMPAKERILASDGPKNWMGTLKGKNAVWKAAVQALPLVSEVKGALEFRESKEWVTAFLLGIFHDKYLLARIYVRQKRFTEAISLLENVVAHLHPKNPDLVVSRIILVRVYVEVQMWREAEPLQEEVVKMKDEKNGAAKDAQELLQPLQLLSHIYRKNNSWSKKHDVDVRLLRYR